MLIWWMMCIQEIGSNCVNRFRTQSFYTIPLSNTSYLLLKYWLRIIGKIEDFTTRTNKFELNILNHYNHKRESRNFVWQEQINQINLETTDLIVYGRSQGLKIRIEREFISTMTFCYNLLQETTIYIYLKWPVILP